MPFIQTPAMYRQKYAHLLIFTFAMGLRGARPIIVASPGALRSRTDNTVLILNYQFVFDPLRLPTHPQHNCRQNDDWQ